MCRSVADAALLLGAIAGYDPLDAASVDAPIPDYTRALRTKVSGFRLGVPRAIFFDQLDPEIAAATNKALEVLDKLTAGARDVRLPAYENPPVLAAEAYAYHLPYFSKTPDLYQPLTRARIESGAKISAAAYIQGRRELDHLRRAVLETFATVDLLITPTTPVPPATIEEAKLDVPPIGNVPSSLRNTSPFDIYGLPTISIPCGFTNSGLPIGIQISGPHLGESQVLALAHAYEQSTDWHMRRPKLPLE
jgi:aspartyl-tRNA(Asn)/glutamyl-tRNA(Gln) amidotransferase subunit A